MKNFFKQIGISGAAYILIGLVLVGYTIALSLFDDSPYLHSAQAGGEYLINHMHEDGSFVYEYDPVSRETSPSYNILRHAGTAYSLIELYKTTGKDRYLEAAEKALAYLNNQIVPCPTTPGSCVLENNEIKLGGNALAVLAMTEYGQAIGASEPVLERVRALATFMIETQSPSGEFTVHKTDQNGTVDSEFTSLYYPGEAIFALARLYGLDHDRKWMDAAHKGARWLIEVRDAGLSIDELEHDHWLLYGLRELYADGSDPIYLEHAKKIVRAIANEQHTEQSVTNPFWVGGFYNPPRSTPTATRSEGLGAAYQLFTMAGEKEYAQLAYETMKKGIEFQLRTQFTKEQLEAINGDVNAVGGFHESLNEYGIRIDYVQHNISALLAFDEIRQ